MQLTRSWDHRSRCVDVREEREEETVKHPGDREDDMNEQHWERGGDAKRSGRARSESLVLISRTVLYDVTSSAWSSSAGRERRDASSSPSDARYEPDYGVPVDASALSSSAPRASADLLRRTRHGRLGNNPAQAAPGQTCTLLTPARVSGLYQGHSMVSGHGYCRYHGILWSTLD